ncbi:MAG: hypothetical protein WCK75_11755 [Elusimicrobiota bacterium]
MSDLPEINLKEKKDEKKGFLPWLRSHLGVSGSGPMGGPGASGAANFGRALGAGRFGASSGSGVGALFAGKAGLIVTVAVMSAAIGTTLYMKDSFAPVPNKAVFSSNSSSQGNYIPAIMRAQQNQGSSLEMFRDTNKGALNLEEEVAASNVDTSQNTPAPAQDTGEEAKAPALAPDNMAQEMMAKLGAGGGVSSTMGNAGSKFSNMGGFSNKFNSGAAGGPGSIGSGFQSSPKF